MRIGAILTLPALGIGVVLLAGIAAATGDPPAPTGGQTVVGVAVAAGYTPGATCAPPATAGEPAASVTGFSGEQLDNAAVIVATGQSLGVPDRGLVIAVATAMQESTLRNLDYGDIMANGRMSSSLGLFQQIAAWAPAHERLDPATSATMFFTGGHAGQPGLLDIPGWQDMPLTVAAQAVQQSGLPDAYAKWEDPARAVVGTVTGRTCTTPDSLDPGGDAAQVVIARARSQLGVPYSWGGGNADGPTLGISDGGGVADAHGDYATVGFDCSGLALYAYAGIGVDVPHQTQLIWAAFPHILDRNHLQAGDLLLYSSNGATSGIHHVGIFLGGDAMIEAPQSGDVVKITTGIWTGHRGTEYIGAVRPGTTTPV